MDTSSRIGPAEALALISRELEHDNLDFALRFALQAITDLPKASDSELGENPGSAGDERFDALLAVAIAVECTRRGHDAPSWTDVPPLEHDWFVWADAHGPSAEWAERIRARTPGAYAALRVFISDRDLAGS